MSAFDRRACAEASLCTEHHVQGRRYVQGCGLLVGEELGPHAAGPGDRADGDRELGAVEVVAAHLRRDVHGELLRAELVAPDLVLGGDGGEERCEKRKETHFFT